MEEYDVVIIGAGPAGLKCAKILAENNIDFIILERKSQFDRKICTGMWALTEKTKAIGLPEELFQKKFKKIIVSTPEKITEIQLEYPIVSTINRKELSEYMFNELKDNKSKVLFGKTVNSIEKDFVVCDDEKIYFDHLVGADGSYSVVRKHLNLPQKTGMAFQYWLNQEFDDLEVHFDADKFGPWYSWVAPHKKITSIGTGSDPSIISSQKIRENLISWCKERNFDISSLKLEGAPINYNYSGHQFGNISLIGDAAGFTPALVADGIYFGMASGEDIAKSIIDKNHKTELINDILRIKNGQETILKLIENNKTLEKIEQSVLLELLKIKFFDKELLKFVG